MEFAATFESESIFKLSMEMARAFVCDSQDHVITIVMDRNDGENHKQTARKSSPTRFQQQITAIVVTCSTVDREIVCRYF